MAKDEQGGFDPFAGESIRTPGRSDDVAPADTDAKTPRSNPSVQPADDPFADVDLDAAEERHDYEDAAVSKMNEETSRIVRGSEGKKLWACPHCRAKNKPMRNKCRSCGKSPDDPVALWRRPWFPFAALAVVVVLVVLPFLGGGPDFKRAPARAAGLDHQVRQDSSGGEPVGIGEATFTPAGRLAVCGRVLAVESRREGETAIATVFLALGRPDTVGKDANFEKLQPVIMEHKLDINFDSKAADRELYWYCQLHIIDEEGYLEPRYGQYLSLTGLHGSVEGWGDWTETDRSGEWIVLPTTMVMIADP